MSPSANNSSRRHFIGDSLKLGVVSLVAAPGHARGDTPPAGNSPDTRPILAWPDMPARVFIEHEAGQRLPATREGSRFTTPRASVTLEDTAAGRKVLVHCPQGPLCRVILRWDAAFPTDSLYLGDHWERAYGDLQWRHLQPERVMPWYFAAHQESSGRTFMAGVMTGCSALCFWLVDATGVSLWMDFRNGGDPSIPGDRQIPAATIVTLASDAPENPMEALTRFCRKLCPAPRLPASPVCGNNNWYYAYGKNFDASAMRRDATFLSELAGDHSNRPFCVIDAGWTPGGYCPGGPWDIGDAARFPDMPGLAAEMKRIGVRPGIWIRPTALTDPGDGSRIRMGPANMPEKPLDPTIPENLAGIREDMARMCSWGYELIKHDFSTFDLLGKWGPEMGANPTDPGWHFKDRSLTNAEIILKVYQAMRDGAGDAILIGCNTIGHLAAGLFELQRTGDDTSGKIWERTRRMGINTLAFRMPQHRTFFIADADCAAHTELTPWEFDRRFLELVARSGTSLFVSTDPTKITPEKKKAFQDAVRKALSGGDPGSCAPTDWLHNTTPRTWKLGDETVTYQWEEPIGADPFKPPY